MLTINDRDIQVNWHPCSQMKDYEQFKPLVIRCAYESYLELDSGKKLIDATASWWCKSLGHNHPALKRALIKQANEFEHVIFANTTYENITLLSEQLLAFSLNTNKIFYASDGSSAIEIAMKMSLHSRQLLGQTHKTQFMALENAYHGETFGAMSVSDCPLYKAPYHNHSFNVNFIRKIPYVNQKNNACWQNCEAYWPAIEQQLEQHANHTTAIIIEPILQAAGGMKIYSADFLRRLSQWAKSNDIHIIADEIMTGFGRTGKMLACDHAEIQPDFICLGKALTGGWLPLSAVLTTDTIYQLFYDDYQLGKSFLHSHTHSGNALAVSVALACLQLYEQEKIVQTASDLESDLSDYMHEVADATHHLINIRHIGALVAADLDCSANQRIGYAVYQEAVKLGALLRPLGNTIYWCPPLNIKPTTLKKLRDITLLAINQAFTN